jgi:hypothetical protein
MSTAEIDNSLNKNKSELKGRTKQTVVPKYGLALLRHLCTEYRVIVSRRNLDKKDLSWQEQLIDDKENDPISVGWNDICEVEQAVLSVVEDEGLIAKARILRERYRMATDAARYHAYEESLPKPISKLADIDIKNQDVKTSLCADICHLIFQLYWTYDSTTQSSALRYNTRWYVTVFLGILIAFTLVSIGWDWQAAIKSCDESLQKPFPVIGAIAFMGACGACVSFLRRLSQLPPNIETLSAVIELRNGWIDAALAIVSGCFFAIFLLVIFASDIPTAIFSQNFLPKFDESVAPACLKTSKGTLVGFLKSLYVADRPQMAIVFIFSFIAGFAEQFVPDVINKFVKLSQIEETKK